MATFVKSTNSIDYMDNTTGIYTLPPVVACPSPRRTGLGSIGGLPSCSA